MEKKFRWCFVYSGREPDITMEITEQSMTIQDMLKDAIPCKEIRKGVFDLTLSEKGV